MADGSPDAEGSFLARTRARKTEEVAARRREVSAEALADSATPTTRSLKGALARPRLRAILELKRRSPSEGSLAPSATPTDVIADYEGVADGLSVLADSAFDGSLDDVAAVRAQTALPILCKDFVLGPDQVLEARVAGADAALIVLALVDDEVAKACLAQADRLGMDVLVEAHDAQELERAIALGAALIGINNRDLGTLSIDLGTTERLASLVPDDQTLIGESGVRDRVDVERLAPHVDGLLIGSAPMRAADRFDAVRALMGPRMKICGLGHPDDARHARSIGARYGGVIFADGSPRQVNSAQAKLIAEAAPDLPLVGVFRGADVDAICQRQASLDLVAVQLHDAAPSLVAAARERLPAHVEVWAAVGVDEDGVVAPPPKADRLVFDRARRDATGKAQTGGTGLRIPETVLASLDLDGHLLAGGLSPTNIEQVRDAGAYCLDASSSIELSGPAPRRKDHAAMTELMTQLRPACRSDGRRG